MIPNMILQGMAPRTVHGDLWEPIEQMLTHGVVAVKVHKVKAHVDPESTTQDPAHTAGNEHADTWAKVARDI